jgi:hypothetical protein
MVEGSGLFGAREGPLRKTARRRAKRVRFSHGGLVVAAILCGSCYEAYGLVRNAAFSPIRVEVTFADGSKAAETLDPNDYLCVHNPDHLSVRALRASSDGGLLWELGPADIERLRGAVRDDIIWDAFLDGARPTPDRHRTLHP